MSTLGSYDHNPDPHGTLHSASTSASTVPTPTVPAPRNAYQTCTTPLTCVRFTSFNASIDALPAVEWKLKCDSFMKGMAWKRTKCDSNWMLKQVLGDISEFTDDAATSSCGGSHCCTPGGIFTRDHGIALAFARWPGGKLRLWGVSVRSFWWSCSVYLLLARQAFRCAA